MKKDIIRRVAAEFFGTLWLTFGGCGAAMLAAPRWALPAFRSVWL
jgi:aquaporin Z